MTFCYNIIILCSKSEYLLNFLMVKSYHNAFQNAPFDNILREAYAPPNPPSRDMAAIYLYFCFFKFKILLKYTSKLSRFTFKTKFLVEHVLEPPRFLARA